LTRPIKKAIRSGRIPHIPVQERRAMDSRIDYIRVEDAPAFFGWSLTNEHGDRASVRVMVVVVWTRARRPVIVVIPASCSY